MRPIDNAQLDPQTREKFGWHGLLDLRFANVNGKTLPIKNYSTSPLRIQRPFYAAAAPEHCQSVIVHTAGGMVGGDQLDMAITAAADTQTLVTTAAAHKVYRSQGDWAQQTIQLTVGSAAYMEWLPQELILFDGGQFQQSLKVDLDPGGKWMGWDITRFGRSARGETFKSGWWRSSTEIWQQGIPLWIDRQQLTGGSDVLTSYHGLAGYAVAGTFLFLGQTMTDEQLGHMRESIQLQGDVGVTLLPQGLVARYRGPSSQTARQYFIKIWQYLRTEILAQRAYLPRVWGV